LPRVKSEKGTGGKRPRGAQMPEVNLATRFFAVL
jgi:hypothetical protein